VNILIIINGQTIKTLIVTLCKMTFFLVTRGST
jgi:hypothetical protein